MRIISGKFKGRTFYPPARNWPTRPTTDIAREGLYNILQNRLDFSSIRMLDLFGGTGSHSLECISRGCTDVTYVDRFLPCVNFIRKMAKELDIEEAIHIYREDVFKFCQRTKEKFDYIFAGPPYAMKEIYRFHEFVLDQDILQQGGIFILETNQKYDFSESPAFDQVRNYGQCHFSFFSKISL